MNRFTDKAVLVTGGTSGIGLATAQRLAAEGARLAVTGTNDKRLAAVRRQIPGALALKNDAAEPAAAEALGAWVRPNWVASTVHSSMPALVAFSRLRTLPQRSSMRSTA